jgi:mannosyltransferase
MLSNDNANQSRDYVLLSLLAVAAFITGLYRLDYQSIWLDEFTTLNVTSSLQTIKGYFQVFPEQHPLYYYLVYFLKANQDLFTLRLLSLIFGVLSLFPLFLIGRRLFSRKIAFLSCTFFVLSPFTLYYNQEGRMYTLLMFLALVQVCFFIIWVQDKSAAGRIGVVAASVLALYTHFFAILLLGSEVLFLLLVYRSRGKLFSPVELGLVFFLVGLSYLPWFIFFLNNIGNNNQDWKGIQNILFAIPYTFFRFAFGYAVLPLSYDVKAHTMKYLPNIIFWCLVLCLAYLPSGILLRRSYGSRKPMDKLIPFLAIVPIVMINSLSIFKNVVSERYVIYSAPFLYLTIVSVFSFVPQRLKGWASVSIILPMLLMLVGLYSYYFNSDFGKTDYKNASLFIRRSATSDAVILCKPGHIGGPLDYYLKKSFSIKSFVWWNDFRRETIWTLENMNNEVRIDLSKRGYYKRAEKVWFVENGLRLVEWQSTRK